MRTCQWALQVMNGASRREIGREQLGQHGFNDSEHHQCQNLSVPGSSSEAIRNGLLPPTAIRRRPARLRPRTMAPESEWLTRKKWIDPKLDAAG